MLVAQPTMLDLLKLCNQALIEERVQYEALTGRRWQVDAVAHDYFGRLGPKWVLVGDDGEPLVAAGFESIIPGVWRCWMVGTPAAWASQWRKITKEVRTCMDRMLAEGGARRIELLCLASRTKACRWYLKGLKMNFEGAHLGYGVNGETAATYARVAPGEGRRHG